MNQTINVSLPKGLNDLAKAQVKAGLYSSVSEVIRDALRRLFGDNQQITVNGFTKEFEDKVLEASRSPRDNDVVIETDEDLENLFKQMGIKTK